MIEPEVPSPIDLKSMDDALEWERNAMQRPFRTEFFEAFSRELLGLNLVSLNVLELGSGPGFLAEYLLSKIPELTISLLDNSPAMHEIAKNRLEHHVDRVEFIERDFKKNNWNVGLGKFNVVITLQAVHELRHKRYATELHSQVRPLLDENGDYLFCDHFYGDEAMKNNQLFMSLIEQHQSLEAAGFTYKEILIKGGRALYHAA